MILKEDKRRTRRRTCSRATSSTTNFTLTDLGSKLGLRGEREETNRLLGCFQSVRVTRIYLKIQSVPRSTHFAWVI